MRNPTLIIDMSTVVRHEYLPGWQQFEDVVAAWKKDQDSDAVVLGVADNSLWYELDKWGQEQFNRWQRAGRARRTPWADPLVCELAEAYPHAKVLTSDKYRDLRREFPWLQGSDRFVNFNIDSAGVTFTPASMSAIPDDEISMYDEKAGMKPRRLTTPEGQRLLLKEWACLNGECPWSQAPAISELPINRDGTAVCPNCDQPLRAVGDASRTFEIKVIINESEVAQLPVVEGSSITLGRGGGEDRFDVRSLLDPEVANLVSRNHLKISNVNGSFLVEDLASKNGTELVREDGSTSRLPASVLQRLAPHERITLAAHRVTIRRSGKRNARGVYVADRGTPLSEPIHTRVADPGMKE